MGGYHKKVSNWWCTMKQMVGYLQSTNECCYNTFTAHRYHRPADEAELKTAFVYNTQCI